jgi:hypothetical protein
VIYLANPCGDQVIAAMHAGHIGLIDTPIQQQPLRVGQAHAGDVPWSADNGCFTDRWDPDRWWAFLVDNAHRAGTCIFATAPDVVGDAQATLERSAPWLPKIRALGYPAALVAQDGLEDLDVPWATFDVLFIGGTTDWKLGPAARELVAEAKRRGKRAHMGRVNSEKRLRYAAAIGCDSADGTFLTFGPDKNLPQLLTWIRGVNQPTLTGAAE